MSHDDVRNAKNPPSHSFDAEGQPRTLGGLDTKEKTMKRIIIGGLLSGSSALAGLGLSMGTAQAFNPQPDPPGKVATSRSPIRASSGASTHNPIRRASQG
jgi:hypothetical protein